MTTNQKQNEEEVDLGSLFVIIGKGIKNFFNFISSVFKGIFHLFILFLLFVKKHLIKFTVAIVIGSIGGSFLEFSKTTTYGSSMLLQPNFKSARQLYDNINYYNDLVKQKDFALLASTFGITKQEAGSLKKFDITPVKSESDIIESYDDLILSVDTLTVKSLEFNRFRNSFSLYDYNVHKVVVEGTNKYIFEKLDETIIASITQNRYFDKVKALTTENLNLTDSLLRQNLVKLDTLRKVYMKVLLDQAQKNNTGTNIDLGSQNKGNKELKIFETDREINDNLTDISKEISEKSEVINVISNFQPIGYKISTISRNYIFLIAALSVLLVLIFVLLKDLNKYLSNYKK